MDITKENPGTGSFPILWCKPAAPRVTVTIAEISSSPQRPVPMPIMMQQEPAEWQASGHILNPRSGLSPCELRPTSMANTQNGGKLHPGKNSLRRFAPVIKSAHCILKTYRYDKKNSLTRYTHEVRSQNGRFCRLRHAYCLLFHQRRA